MSSDRLVRRFFDIDMRLCPNCGGGELKTIAAILERPVIEKILTHLGLDPEPPPRGRARQSGARPRPLSGTCPRRHPTHQHRLRCQAAAGVALRRMSARGPKSEG